MSDKAIFEKAAPYNYIVPIYTVVEGKGIELINSPTKAEDDRWIVDVSSNLLINMLRGSKIEDENVLPKIDGVLVEQLLAVCIDHLKAVNVGELKNSYTDAAIDALEEAGLFLEARENKRRKENTLGTYKK